MKLAPAVLLPCLAALSLTACKGEAPAAPAATGPAALPATQPAASAAAAAGHRKMANCPSSVEGAKTAYAAVEGGAEVTITATRAGGADEIRARAKHLVEISSKDPGAPTHTGEGEGGGMLGQCPVVLNDTTLMAADVADGVKVTVKPNKAENVAWLQKEVEARTTKAPR